MIRNASSPQRPRIETHRLAEDGVLEVTAAFGFDEKNTDVLTRKHFKDGLEARGFVPLQIDGLSDEQLRSHGLDPSRVDRAPKYGGKYWVKTTERDGKPLRVVLHQIDRYTQDPVDQLGKALSGSDVIMYSGHSRYGSGPDFDQIESPEKNFVIGLHAKGHADGTLTPAFNPHMAEVLRGRPNHLEQVQMPNKHQLLFLDSCVSQNFWDELREIPKNKNTANLDIIGTSQDVPTRAGGMNLLQVLDGVLEGKPVDEVTSALTSYNKAQYTHDGFGDNAG